MIGLDAKEDEEDVISENKGVAGNIHGKETKETKDTGVSVIDQITESTSLMDIAKNGAFTGMSDEQRQSATFKTGAVLGVSVHELGKALDPDIPKEESFKRGATGLIGLFEIFFSAKNIHEGLSKYSHGDRQQRRSKYRKPHDYDVRDYDGYDDDDHED